MICLSTALNKVNGSEPATQGLYCEAQASCQCGAHAINAIRGPRAAADRIAGPQYMYPHLAESAEEAAYVQPKPTPWFARTGNYAMPAMQHWLYEHTHENCMLVTVASIGLSYKDPKSLSKQEILARAPPNCKAFLIWYQYNDCIPHYSAWIQARDGEWYDCESIAYAATGKVRQLQDSDWAQLAVGKVYCLGRG